MVIDPEKLDWLRRNSKIGLDRHGQWTFEGSAVENSRVAELFHAGVRVDDEGQPTLHVGKQWCFIQHVEDTIRFVGRLQVRDDGLWIRLLGGHEEPLDLSSLSAHGTDNLYCVLSDGVRARFVRSALIELAPYLDEQADQFGVVWDGDFHPVKMLE